MIMLLAIAGGGVDTVAILGLNVLTGAQTGNTILLAAAVARQSLVNAVGSTFSVVAFIIATALGEVIIVRFRKTSAVTIVLISELVALGCLLILWHLAGPDPAQKTRCILILCAASAMGLQSSAMLSLHHNPTTTYVTGTLTTFATRLIRWLRLLEKASASLPERRDSIRRDLAVDSPWLHGLTWFVYVAGAVSAGLLFLHIRERALVLPIITIMVAAIAGHSVEKWHVDTELEQGPNDRNVPERACPHTTSLLVAPFVTPWE